MEDFMDGCENWNEEDIRNKADELQSETYHYILNRLISEGYIVKSQPVLDVSSTLEGLTKKRSKKRFVKPTVEEVKLYIQGTPYQYIDAEQFVTYYDQVGWVVGKTQKPMKSWEAAIRLWHKKEKTNQPEIKLAGAHKPYKPKY